MKTAIVIFNGINYPYHLADHAIEWAATNEAELQALFLKADKDPDEGYIFPSDLDMAENLTEREDAEKDDLQLIEDYIKLLIDTSRTKGVAVKAQILTDPSLEQLLDITKTAERIFVDGSVDREAIFAARSFDMADLIKQSIPPVEQVYKR